MRERKNGVIEWTMRHYQITLLVITVLVGLGILGLVDMPKQEFPEFTIRQGVVVGVYPGRLQERWRSSWPSLWRDTCLPSRR